jgi:hypothetical protein
MIKIHVFLARICEAEVASELARVRPCVPLVPVALTTRIVEVWVGRLYFGEFRFGFEMVNLEEFCAAQTGFGALTVSTKLSEVYAQKGAIILTISEVGRRLKSNESGHTRSPRTFKTRK